MTALASPELQTNACVGTSLTNFVIPPGFCTEVLPGTSNRDKWRSIISLSPTTLLAMRRNPPELVYIEDSNGDGLPDFPTTLLTAPPGQDILNHGLALKGGYVYASSSTTVWRWKFNNSPVGALPTVGDPERVVVNMNADGQGGAPLGHTTRTIILDESDRLYVAIGSAKNVDPDSYRARIRRFDLSDGDSKTTSTLTLPIEFESGEVFADGLRNEVGLAFDNFGILWGVENGADQLQRGDLGGDIHNDNPGEELNRFTEDAAGKHWGYPYCWSEYRLGETFERGRGTAWAWPTFMNVVTDRQCREEYEPSIVSMQAHSAPLGIVFYQHTSGNDTETLNCSEGAFPKEMDGFAFIAFHGSWNRDVPTGYKVVYIPMNTTTGMPLGDGTPIDLLAHAPPNSQWGDGFRPVDVDFDGCGRLLVTSDGSSGKGSKIVRIAYNGGTFSEQTGIRDEPNQSAMDGADTSSSYSVHLHPFILIFLTVISCRQLFGSRK